MSGNSSSQNRGRWLVAGPPLAYLLIFFAIPTLLMVAASFRMPGEFGGLAPLTNDNGGLALTLKNYGRFFESSIYLQLFV